MGEKGNILSALGQSGSIDVPGPVEELGQAGEHDRGYGEAGIQAPTGYGGPAAPQTGAAGPSPSFGEAVGDSGAGSQPPNVGPPAQNIGQGLSGTAGAAPVEQGHGQPPVPPANLGVPLVGGVIGGSGIDREDDDDAEPSKDNEPERE